ncbi:MAG: NAD-dependent epimerase/dehydratase family protein [Betaproteobacteria bacterium]|nr:NAD-dependent epimerase/dehydratase family protein [Betaproteobacteria bacterium]
MKCFVTGANGFIGRHLVSGLLAAGYAVRAATSSGQIEALGEDLPIGAKTPEIVRVAQGALEPAVWQAVCRDVEIVFHLAGRAQRGKDALPGARQEYFRDNLQLTRVLAEAALAARVKRFVFASSVTVYGASSAGGQAFREDSPPLPEDAYAQSKLATEEFLLAKGGDLAPVIVRLPLVYGAGVKGNMAALARLAQSGLPLPLAGINNRRSFVNIPNCVDFLLAAACHPESGGRVLLVSDREDVATPDLLRMLAHAAGKRARLFAVPPPLLQMACTLLGQKARFAKISGNFQIDPAASCALLGWQPRVSLAEGIAGMCAKLRDS